MASNFSDRKLIGLYAMSDHFRGIATAVGGSPKYEGFIPVLDKHGMLDSSIIPGEAGNVARQLAEEITNREAADDLIMSAVDEHTNNRRNPHAVRASQIVADSGTLEDGDRVMRLQAEKVFVESTSYDTNDQPVITSAELVTFANIEGAVASVIGEVLAGNMLLRGYVAVKTDLPQTADEGDVYIARDTGVAYLYDGTSWVVLGGVEDALTKSEANSTYLKLVGGTVTGDIYKASETLASVQGHWIHGWRLYLSSHDTPVHIGFEYCDDCGPDSAYAVGQVLLAKFVEGYPADSVPENASETILKFIITEVQNPQYGTAFPGVQSIRATARFGNVEFELSRTYSSEDGAKFNMTSSGFIDERQRANYGDFTELDNPYPPDTINFYTDNTPFVTKALADWTYATIEEFEAFHSSAQAALDSMSSRIHALEVKAEEDPVFSTWNGGTSIAAGSNASAGGANAVALGNGADGSQQSSVAVGYNAKSTAGGAVQLGTGTNSNSNSLKFRDTIVVDGNGKIPSGNLDGVFMPARYIGSDGSVETWALGHTNDEILSLAFGQYAATDPRALSAFAMGQDAEANHSYAVVISCRNDSTPHANASNGDETFNVYTQDGASGFYINGQTLTAVVNEIITSAIASKVAGTYLPLAGGNLTGSIYQTSQSENNKYLIKSEVAGLISAAFDQCAKLDGGAAFTGNVSVDGNFQANEIKVPAPTQSDPDRMVKVATLDDIVGHQETDPVFTAWKNGTSIAAGQNADASQTNSVAIGTNASTAAAQSNEVHALDEAQGAVAIGYNAKAPAAGAIQIGTGQNTTPDTLQVGSVTVMTVSTGKLTTSVLPSSVVQKITDASGTHIDVLDLPPSAVKKNANGRINTTDLPSSVVLADYQGSRINPLLMPSSVPVMQGSQSSGYRINVANMPPSVVTAGSGGRIPTSALPATISAGRIYPPVPTLNPSAANPRLSSVYLPDSVVYVNQDGKITSGIIPDSIPRLSCPSVSGASCKIPEAYIPSVFMKTTSTIGSGQLPSSVVYGSGPSHIVPSSRMPGNVIYGTGMSNTVPSSKLPAGIVYAGGASGRLPSGKIPATVVYYPSSAAGTLSSTQLPANVMYWPSGYSSTIPPSMLPSDIVYASGGQIPSGKMPYGVVYASGTISPSKLPSDIVYASGGQIPSGKMPSGVVYTSGPYDVIPTNKLPVNLVYKQDGSIDVSELPVSVARIGPSGLIASSVIPPEFVQLVSGRIPVSMMPASVMLINASGLYPSMLIPSAYVTKAGAVFSGPIAYSGPDNPYIDENTLVSVVVGLQPRKSLVVSEINAPTTDSSRFVFSSMSCDDAENIDILVHTPEKFENSVLVELPSSHEGFARSFRITVETLVHRGMQLVLQPHSDTETVLFVGDSVDVQADNRYVSLMFEEASPGVFVVARTDFAAGSSVTINGSSITYSDIEQLDLNNANVILPDATSIAANAFVNTGVRSVVAPKLVSIGANAFSGCSKLLFVIAGCSTSNGADAFTGCGSLVYFSPFGSVSKNSNDQYVFDDGTTQTVVTGVTPSDLMSMSGYPFGITDSVISCVFGDGCIEV